MCLLDLSDFRSQPKPTSKLNIEINQSMIIIIYKIMFSNQLKVIITTYNYLNL